MKENKPWLCILTSSHSTSPRIRSFWLYNIHVGSCGSQARPICCGVTMSSTGNFNSQHFNSGRLNLMYSHALKEPGSFKALKYSKKGWWQSWVLAPVLPVGKFPLISPEPALHSVFRLCIFRLRMMFYNWDLALKKIKWLWHLAECHSSKAF